MPETRDPKTIEGKATRRQRYDPMFFWYVPLVSAVLFGFTFYASGWDYRLAFGFGFPCLAIGVVIGVSRFRDVP